MKPGSLLLMIAALLAACQSPRPQPPTRPSSPLPSTSTPSPASTLTAWQVWSAAAYPQGVFDLAYGDDGLGAVSLWAATSFGVARIDPLTRAYTADGTLGPISRLLPIENGRVLAVGERGLIFFDGRAWQSITISSTYGFFPASVYALGIDTLGDVWLFAGVSRGVVTIHLPGHEPPRDGPWTALSPAAAPASLDPRSCTSWRAYNEYRFTYHTPEECQQLMAALQAFEQRSQYGPLAADTDGTAWWLNADRLQHLRADGTLISQLPIASGSRLLADPRGGVWAATTEGVFYATDGRLQHVSLGLERYTLYLPRAVAVETNGRVWAATERGLQRLKADTQQWLIEADTHLGGVLNQSPAASLAAAPSGGLWLTHGFDLLHYDGTTVTSLMGPPADSGCGLGPLQIDRAGDLWAVGYQCGVWHYRAASSAWQGHLTNQYIDQLAVGADGTVTALTGDGQLLARPLNGEWSTLGAVDRTVDVIMVSDQRGGAWVGARFSGEVTHYPAGAPPQTDKVVDANTYFTLLSEPAGQLWLSQRDRTWRFDGARWQPVVMPAIGLMNTLAAAPDGRLWFTGERGIAVYDPARDPAR